MAKIIVSALSNVTWLKGRYIDSFVEGLNRALVRCGNDVLNIRVNDFYFYGKNLASRTALKRRINQFNPELIITLNNELPYAELVDDVDCPIACLAADSYAFFANKDKISKYADRYYFFNFSNDTINTLYDWIPSALPDRNFLFGHATDLRAEMLDQDIDISFVGSMGNWNKSLVHYFQRIPHVKGLSYSDQNKIKNFFFDKLEAFQNDPFMKIDEDQFPYYKAPFPIEVSLIHLLTCRERFKVLSAISDLGLSIYGWPDAYAEILLYDPQLFRRFDFTPSVTLQDTTMTYNRSKISLNLPHGHAKEGFSWRVCDILASNATLISCRQPDLVKLSRGYVDLPMFESESEARDICKKLLADPSWRRDLTLASQQMIEDRSRFESRFEMMQQVIPNCSLLASIPGTINMLEGEKYLRVFTQKTTQSIGLIKSVLSRIIYREITIPQAAHFLLSKLIR